MRFLGLKPTWGLVPYTGIIPIDPTIDHTGPMAKTVEDCALLLEVHIKGCCIRGNLNGTGSYIFTHYFRLSLGLIMV